ncbi:multiheme c-type cytochrome [Thiohalomonas denitrificans]|uniref:Cytochrome c554 and c-prime n=1 Tax=Thiohalomonas denitrificans TaxID=415747 RepID=A0A1G5Q9F8_9GAMM|nr:multiheme c-type cytochrome [Thiohalomonas denitrificans]SCZ58011.1 Cytochrome c554 and c-prime [Thiohalomonas denitrificans]
MKRYLISAIALLAVTIAGGWFWTTSAEDSVEIFLDQHWAHPIAPQGTPPAGFSPLEASLGAEACAQCHPDQHRDWRQSLHRKALSPGIRWQLRLMDQEAANECLRCHAPLAEQKALLAREHGWPNAPAGDLPEYVPLDLGHQGVMCSSCHLRDHQRFGPPPRGATREPAHDGFEVRAAYQDSRFCATCHQFPEDGPRLNGKLREDTLAQWQASPWAGEKTCQQCHMPDRRHEFRGIHDPEMVRRAVELMLEVVEGDDQGLMVEASLGNVGAGHHFPTYMVPKVYLQLSLVGPQRQRRPLAERIIGWQVDTAITKELADTRLPAGEWLKVRQPLASPPGEGWVVEATLTVAPAEHYERTYIDMLKQADKMDAETLRLLRQALTEARATRFEALRLRQPVPGGAS